MNDYLPKPIQVPELFAVLSRWIKMPGDRPFVAAELLVSADGVESEFGQPGINVVAGLSHVQGNTKLYRRILLKFRDSQADLLEQLRLALAGGDVSAAVRQLHTLKGLAGNIGATTLSKTANLLEMELRNNTEGQLEELMQKLEADMIPVLVEIEGFAGGAESQEEAHKISRPVDREAVEPFLEPLRAALLDNDAGAVKIVAQLCVVLRDTSEEETMQAIARAVENYDFDKALKRFVAWQQSRL
jgi:FOG: HPt domain